MVAVNPKWLVPTIATEWLGKKRKRTFPIYIDCSEWQAQTIAGFLLKFCMGGRKDHCVGKRYIDHAINFKTKVCSHGDCKV